jgi:NADP-dependent 3-hydroxy acid dehydrogenase YdfG
MEIKEKVIIITGASGGIGLATARYLSAQGAKLVLAARSEDKLKDIVKELPNAIAVPTDMRNPADIKNMIDQTIKAYGRIDMLINNAGQGMFGPVEDIDVERYKEIMELNVYGVLRAMQAVIPVMRKQGGGMIVNISSMVSKNSFPGLAAYASTKYALNAISLTARRELKNDHIVVVVFHPKMTATDFGTNIIGDHPDMTKPSEGQPAPVIDTPEQVAEKISALILSEEPEASM